MKKDKVEHFVRENLTPIMAGYLFVAVCFGCSILFHTIYTTVHLPIKYAGIMTYIQGTHTELILNDKEMGTRLSITENEIKKLQECSKKCLEKNANEINMLKMQ